MRVVIAYFTIVGSFPRLRLDVSDMEWGGGIRELIDELSRFFEELNEKYPPPVRRKSLKLSPQLLLPPTEGEKRILYVNVFPSAYYIMVEHAYRMAIMGYWNRTVPFSPILPGLMGKRLRRLRIIPLTILPQALDVVDRVNRTLMIQASELAERYLQEDLPRLNSILMRYGLPEVRVDRPRAAALLYIFPPTFNQSGLEGFPAALYHTKMMELDIRHSVILYASKIIDYMLRHAENYLRLERLYRYQLPKLADDLEIPDDFIELIHEIRALTKENKAFWPERIRSLRERLQAVKDRHVENLRREAMELLEAKTSG